MFTIPNEVDAAFAAQSEPHSVDIDAIVQGFLAPHGVEGSGCAVTDGTAAMDLNVAVGTVRIEGRRVAVTAGDVTISTADVANPRIDIITVTTAGTKTVTAGTAAADPATPAVPASQVLLAAVWVPANDTTMEANQITDKRIPVHRPPYEDPAWYGAVEDGTTDDTTAIEAADTAAVATDGNRLVRFRASSYGVGTMLNIAAGVTWQGAGMGQTTFLGLAGLTTGVINLGGADACLRDCTVDGNIAVVTATTVDGVRAAGDRPRIIDVESTNCSRSGFFVTGVAEPKLIRVIARDVNKESITGHAIHLTNCTGGGYIDRPEIRDWGPGNANGIYINNSPDTVVVAPKIDLVTDQQTGHGIIFAGTSHRGKVFGPDIDRTAYTGTTRTGAGVSFFGPTDCQLIGGTILHSVSTDAMLEPVQIDNGSVRCCVVGVNVSGGDDQGITLWAAESRVEGCHVDNTWGSGIASNSARQTIVNNVVQNCGRGGTSSDAGIELRSGATDCAVTGNTCYDDQGGGATQKYGISEASGADRNIVLGNNCWSNVTADLKRDGAASRFAHNIGDTQEPGHVYTYPFSFDGTLTTTTGGHRAYNDTGRTLTFLSARGTVGTQPTGAAVLVDIHKDGTTVHTTQSNRITIAASTNTDEAASFEVATWADGEYIEVMIDQIGSTIAGADLVVQVFAVAKD